MYKIAYAHTHARTHARTRARTHARTHTPLAHRRALHRHPPLRAPGHAAHQRAQPGREGVCRRARGQHRGRRRGGRASARAGAVPRRPCAAALAAAELPHRRGERAAAPAGSSARSRQLHRGHPLCTVSEPACRRRRSAGSCRAPSRGRASRRACLCSTSTAPPLWATPASPSPPRRAAEQSQTHTHTLHLYLYLWLSHAACLKSSHTYGSHTPHAWPDSSSTCR